MTVQYMLLNLICLPISLCCLYSYIYTCSSLSICPPAVKKISQILERKKTRSCHCSLLPSPGASGNHYICNHRTALNPHYHHHRTVRSSSFFFAQAIAATKVWKWPCVKIWCIKLIKWLKITERQGDFPASKSPNPLPENLYLYIYIWIWIS